MATPLRPGERLDDLLIQNLRIIQHQDQFCFSLDAILLPHFATVKSGASAVDLGTGTGVIALLLTARGARSVTGVELNEYMADMAARSVQLNNLTDKVKILHGDMRRLAGVLPSGAFDLVVSNPPYRPVGGGFLNPADGVAQARHEVTATLKDVVAAARYLVKYRGRFAMVHLPERLADIITAFREADIEPKRLRFVHGSATKKPTMVLIEGIRGAKAGMEVLPPLFVYNPDGTYCKEITTWYEGKA